MTAMVAEVHDALKSAGADDAKARVSPSRSSAGRGGR